jgi:hypothetical protein
MKAEDPIKIRDLGHSRKHRCSNEFLMPCLDTSN